MPITPIVSTRTITDALPTVLSHQPSANAAATKTIGVEDDEFVVIWRIVAGYNASPTITTANLITTGLNTSEGTAAEGNLDIDFVGTMPVVIEGPFYGTIATDVVVTLAAGGAAVTGRINILYSICQAPSAGV